VRVLVIDPALRHLQKERNPEGPLSFFFARDLTAKDEHDLVVLPAGLLLERPSSLHPGIPRIAYGPVELMADAFAEGCDDYLREPWRPEELEARALRFWRSRFRLGDHAYSYSGGRLEGNDNSLLLSEGERRALELLLHRLGRAVPRAAFTRVCGSPEGRKSRMPDMILSRVRSRLVQVSGDPRAGSFLGAVRNYGYRLDGKPCA